MRELASLPLLSVTKPEWLDLVMSQFDDFLVDHAACEYKASSTAMSLMTRYPDKNYLIESMISLARVELEHFRDLHHILKKRGLVMKKFSHDLYVKKLLTQARHGAQEHFIDRMVICGIVEARSCERLFLVAEAIEDIELKEFYRRLAKEEAGHYSIFTRIAKRYSPEDDVNKRIEELTRFEADILEDIPLQATVH